MPGVAPRYRTLGSTVWSQIDVQTPGSTSLEIHNLTPGSTYEFQVQGKNELGDGMFSDIVTASTEGGWGAIYLYILDFFFFFFFVITISP